MGIYEDLNSIYVKNTLLLSSFLKKCRRIKGSSNKLCKDLGFTTSSYKNYLNMAAKTIPFTLLEKIEVFLKKEFDNTDKLLAIMNNKILDFKKLMFEFGSLIREEKGHPLYRHPRYKDILIDNNIKIFVKKIVTYCGGNNITYNVKGKRESISSLRMSISGDMLRYYIYPPIRYNIEGEKLKAYIDVIDLQVIIDIYGEIKNEFLNDLSIFLQSIETCTLGDIAKDRAKKREPIPIEVLRRRYYNGMFKTLSNRYGTDNWTSLHAQKAAIKRIKNTGYSKNITPQIKQECIESLETVKNKGIPLGPSILDKIMIIIKDISEYINDNAMVDIYQKLFTNSRWRQVLSFINVFGEKIGNIYNEKPHHIIPLIANIDDMRIVFNLLFFIDKYKDSDFDFIRKGNDIDGNTLKIYLVKMLNIGLVTTKRNMEIWNINKDIKKSIISFWTNILRKMVIDFKTIDSNLFDIDKLIRDMKN